ncbi:MAG: alpha/beta hydrolase [Deltaproteobacteria bacterium]|nr:alpha/beta hydrolase [Deltaproteobacteria bacterium]
MQLARVLALATALAACGDDGGAIAPDAPGGGPDGPRPDAPIGVVPRVEPGPCRFDVPPALGMTEGQGYACGDLIVYENRTTMVRTISVHYIKFDSPSASPNATIYLAGGPGGDGNSILNYAVVLGSPFLTGLMADGDFLVISQRGTARSIPFLDCQTSNCEDFSVNHDLSAYNTAGNADDVNDLRAALGYTKLNLYGISYGSRLALEIMRRHGDHVRASIIEGLVPSSIAWPAAIPASFYSALTGLNTSCANAGACGTAFGNLVTKFSAGVASLDAEPLPMTFEGQPFDLDGGTYAYVLFRVLYSKSAYVWLPMLISDLAERRIDRVESFFGTALSNLSSSAGVSEGLYNSVVCGEIFNPPDQNAFGQLNAGVPSDIVDMFGGSWFSLMDRCSSWPVHNMQAQLAQPVTSAIRTLVSSGRQDPITPPSFGDVAAVTLSNSVVVIHENSGHGATLQSPCGMQNLINFITDPMTAHDTSCAATIATPYMVGAAFAPTAAVDRIRAELNLAPPLPPFMRERVIGKLAARPAVAP